MNKLMMIPLLLVSVMNPCFGMEPEHEKISSFSPWENARSSEGVSTFVRWIRYTDGSQLRERKGEFVADGSLQAVIELLSDAAAINRWVSGVRENVRLSPTSAAGWYFYTVYDIPWPFRKRDLVSEYSLTRSVNGKSAVISIRSRPDAVSRKKGIERLEDYQASWTLTETVQGKVRVVFSAMSGTPPIFPRYIQDPVIESLFLNNLVRLKKLFSVS